MSYGTILDPVILLGTTAWQKIGQEAAAGKVRAFTLRAANVAAADAYAHVRVANGVTSGRRAINFPVPYEAAGSAPDMEQSFAVPAGWYLEVMASANNAVEFTLSTVEDDA